MHVGGLKRVTFGQRAADVQASKLIVSWSIVEWRLICGDELGSCSGEARFYEKGILSFPRGFCRESAARVS